MELEGDSHLLVHEICIICLSVYFYLLYYTITLINYLRKYQSHMKIIQFFQDNNPLIECAKQEMLLHKQS